MDHLSQRESFVLVSLGSLAGMTELLTKVLIFPGFIAIQTDDEALSEFLDKHLARTIPADKIKKDQ